MTKEIKNLKNIQAPQEDFFLANIIPKNMNNRFSLIDRLFQKGCIRSNRPYF